MQLLDVLAQGRAAVVRAARQPAAHDARRCCRPYLFNRHIIRHRFCPTCGIHPYGEGVDPKGNAMAAVNLRCIEGLDLEAIPVRHFDGRSL